MSVNVGQVIAKISKSEKTGKPLYEQGGNPGYMGGVVMLVGGRKVWVSGQMSVFTEKAKFGPEDTWTEKLAKINACSRFHVKVVADLSMDIDWKQLSADIDSFDVSKGDIQEFKGYYICKD